MFLPVLYMTSNNLRLLAVRADYYVNLYKTPAEQNQEKLEDAARVINRGFTICIADRAPIEESRKWGTYYMTNLLFKMYFKVSKETQLAVYGWGRVLLIHDGSSIR